jgi:hypothetical protein
MGEHELHPIDEVQAERGRAMVQAAVAQTRAPLGLRERIEAQQREVERPARRRWALGGSFAAAAAAVIVAIVVATGGGATGPGVAQAAQLALRAPTAGAPAVDAANPGLLKRSVAGVTYPAWRDRFPWKASGAREDTIDGQRAVTVFYDDPSHVRIGYTILAGKALDEPSGRTVRQGAERYVVLERGARRIVTWRRSGHTCVLSGPKTVPASRLLALASWNGGADTVS